MNSDYTYIKPVTINHMYINSRKFWGKRLLSPWARVYKKHLEDCIQKRMKEYSSDLSVFDIKDKKFFYIIDIYIYLPITKKWGHDKRMFVDLDGLMKPIQDALSTKTKEWRIWVWNDDKQVYSFLPRLNYVSKIEESHIVIDIFEYSEELFSKLTQLVEESVSKAQ